MFCPEPLSFPCFPSSGTIQELLKVSCQHPVFYDIETTGLSRSQCHIYLIGALRCEKGSWILRQWFAEDEKEEKDILTHFLSWITEPDNKTDLLIHFNGDSFDLPFIAARCQVHGLSCCLPGIPSRDLYRSVRPLKALLKLTSLKAEKLEAFCQGSKRESPDGKACLRLYRQFLSARESSIRQILLNHNREDILGMGTILSLSAYWQLGRGNYEIEDNPVLLSVNPAASPASCGKDSDFVRTGKMIRFSLLTDLPVPRPLKASFDNLPEVSIEWDKRSCLVDINLINGRLKLFHADVKNYDYLPDEDTAIPKSLSSFLDRSHRVPATKLTCYTWFPCTDSFLNNPENHCKYLASLFQRLGMSPLPTG